MSSPSCCHIVNIEDLFSQDDTLMRSARIRGSTALGWKTHWKPWKWVLLRSWLFMRTWIPWDTSYVAMEQRDLLWRRRVPVCKCAQHTLQNASSWGILVLICFYFLPLCSVQPLLLIQMRRHCIWRQSRKKTSLTSQTKRSVRSHYLSITNTSVWRNFCCGPRFSRGP